MGARGNSGVILSQIWRGFARGVEGHEIIDGLTFANALALARDTAYKGVVRPVEGTILTVAKDMASAAEAGYAMSGGEAPLPGSTSASGISSSTPSASGRGKWPGTGGPV